MTKCLGIVGWIFGHDYQPRFDVRQTPREVDIMSIGMRGFGETVHELTTLSDRTYRGEVCVRCGHALPTRPAE